MSKELCVTCQRLGSCQFVAAFEAKTKYTQVYNKLDPIPLGLTVGGCIAGAMSGIAPFPLVGALWGAMVGGAVGLAIGSTNDDKMEKYTLDCEEWEKKCVNRD